jgi:hypothetical protein
MARGARRRNLTAQGHRAYGDAHGKSRSCALPDLEIAADMGDTGPRAAGRSVRPDTGCRP